MGHEVSLIFTGTIALSGPTANTERTAIVPDLQAGQRRATGSDSCMLIDGSRRAPCLKD
jgi:hypothetical protein